MALPSLADGLFDLGGVSVIQEMLERHLDEHRTGGDGGATIEQCSCGHEHAPTPNPVDLGAHVQDRTDRHRATEIAFQVCRDGWLCQQPVQ